MHDRRFFALSIYLIAYVLLTGLGCSKKSQAKDGSISSERIHSDKQGTNTSGAEHVHEAAGHSHADDPSQTPNVAPVNAKCPITGDPINPKLTIDYKGKSVGLCCKDCIADWNRLTDAEKDAKLRQ